MRKRVREGCVLPILETYDRDGLHVIVINRPEKLNALNLEMWETLKAELLESCEKSYTGLVITGSGKAFSSGDDVFEMYSFENEEQALHFFEEVYGAVEALVSCDRVVAGLVNGLAYGGGGEILLLLDYTVALETATISYPEARIGLIPPVLLTYGQKILGPRKALQLALTGKEISARDAVSLGLIDDTAKSIDEAFDKITRFTQSIPIGARPGYLRRVLLRSVLPELKTALSELAKMTVDPIGKRAMGEVVLRWMKRKEGS
jgi:enoyl-CoA hydratase/carnithine racemase